MDITREWDQAELDVKTAEQVCQNAIFPAIKELRYAGRRLSDALTAIVQGKPREEVEVLLHEARLDCHRARHDAIDAAISHIGIQISNMENHLGYSAILKAYPGFGAFNRRYLAAQTLIASSRQARHERGSIYEQIEKVNFPGLAAEYSEVKASEPIMKSLAAKGRLVLVGAWIILAVGLVATLLFLLAQSAP